MASTTSTNRSSARGSPTRSPGSRPAFGPSLAGSALLLLALGCAPRFAQVGVESNPTSAQVWIDGKQKDSTPCKLLFEEEREYEVYFKKPGYTTLMRRVTVYEKEGAEGQDELEAIPNEMVVTLDPLDPDAGDGAGGSGDGGQGDTEDDGSSDPYYQ